jgi:FkbM family methyltransferase
MRFTMRDGSLVRCRLLDSGALLSVHVDRDYDIPGLDWSKARTIVDIGAHVGSFTVWAARRSPDARLLAVEPNPETFRLLRQNLDDNALTERASAVNAAVGATAGTAKLELTEHSLGTRLSAHGEGAVPVKVKQLGQLLAEAKIGEVDILKMDCEGMEYDVFDAASRYELGAIHAIACEYHPEPGRDVSELDSILRSAGFRIQRPNAPLGIIWATR